MKQPNSNPTKMTVSAILPNHRKIQLENYHLKPTSRILHRSYDTMSYGNISSQDHQIMLHKKNSKEK